MPVPPRAPDVRFEYLIPSPAICWETKFDRYYCSGGFPAFGRNYPRPCTSALGPGRQARQFVRTPARSSGAPTLSSKCHHRKKSIPTLFDSEKDSNVGCALFGTGQVTLGTVQPEIEAWNPRLLGRVLCKELNPFHLPHSRYHWA